MTGFARVDASLEHRRWSWEVKSVNARGLELRFRLPQGFDALEPVLRKAAKEALSRGAVNAILTLRDESAEGRMRINEQALGDAVAMMARIAQSVECAPPRPEGVLSLRGVMEPADEVEAQDVEALHAALAASFGEALQALQKARREEGGAMAKIVAAQFDEIDALVAKAAKSAAAGPAAIRDRLAAQLKELLDGAGLPEERLAQEAAMLAVKADVREEIDRLGSHLEAGRALMGEAGPVGRQLDFLSQEFNREANTLCAKASDMGLKRIGLDLKKVIDQLREQVQNIE